MTRTEPGACLFDAENHTYTVNGRRVPSVTEIAGLITARKYADTNAAMLEQAQRRGTAVHELCEAIDCGIEPEELEIPPELVGYVNAYLAFLRDWAPEWDYIEKLVWCRDFAGRADRIGRMDGHSCIVDIKTTASMDRLSKLALLFQLFGYRWAWAYMGHGKAEKLLGVQLKKDGKYTLHRSEDIHNKCVTGANLAFVWSALVHITKIIGGYQ